MLVILHFLNFGYGHPPPTLAEIRIHAITALPSFNPKKPTSGRTRIARPAYRREATVLKLKLTVAGYIGM